IISDRTANLLWRTTPTGTLNNRFCQAGSIPKTKRQFRIAWRNQVLRATAGVAYDARKPTRERLVDNEAPGLALIAREDQAVRSHISSGNLGLIEKSRK